MASPVTIKLREPVEFGKGRPLIEEITLKPSARAFKEFSLPMTADGKIDYQPYKLATVGLRMAGHPDSMTDLLGVEDMSEIANVVMGFFVSSPTGGKQPSES